MMPLLVGTSGWQYRDWRGPVYPPREPARRWLELYAAMFGTVEVNSTFYRLPDQDRFRAWAGATPSPFCFAVKASRYLTHIRRLREPADAVARLLDASQGLGRKRGPVLLQLPPTLRADAGALDETVQAFGGRVRVAVEFRHPSWDSREIDAILSGHDASRVLADNQGNITGARTAGWAYVRLHRGRATPDPCYGRTALSSWVTRLVDLWGPSVDGYVYFNNDARACAVRNARMFRTLAAKSGIDAR
jgi:uncharacterized protein YecE (DUF72 family)